MHKSRGKILIIDDDPFFLRLLSDAFEESGYSAITAIDGVEGVKQYLEKKPDAVISDLVMPRMGGVSACMEIRRLAGQEPPVLVLLTSMFHEPAHEHADPEMGASVHIPKATSPVNIVIILEQLLERRQYQHI